MGFFSSVFGTGSNDTKANEKGKGKQDNIDNTKMSSKAMTNGSGSPKTMKATSNGPVTNGP